MPQGKSKLMKTCLRLFILCLTLIYFNENAAAYSGGTALDTDFDFQVGHVRRFFTVAFSLYVCFFIPFFYIITPSKKKMGLTEDQASMAANFKKKSWLAVDFILFLLPITLIIITFDNSPSISTSTYRDLPLLPVIMYYMAFPITQIVAALWVYKRFIKAGLPSKYACWTALNKMNIFIICIIIIYVIYGVFSPPQGDTT